MRSTPIPIDPTAAWVGAVMLAIGWVWLMFNSDNVPAFSEGVWTLACGMAAGSALAAARWRTMFAFRTYVVITGVIGALRSWAYLENNSGGPAGVWFIVTTTTIIGYLMAVEKVAQRRGG